MGKRFWIICLLSSLPFFLYTQIWSPPVRVSHHVYFSLATLDKFDRLWCSSGWDLFYLDTLTGKWQSPKSHPDFKSRSIMAIGRLRNGDLWIVTRGGDLFFYDYIKWTEPISPPQKYVFATATADSANRLWTSWVDLSHPGPIYQGYVSCYDGAEWSDYYPITLKHASAFPQGITTDGLGRIWVSGVSLQDLEGIFFTRYMDKEEWSNEFIIRRGKYIIPPYCWGWLIPDTSGGIWVLLSIDSELYAFTYYYDGVNWNASDSFFTGPPYISGSHPTTHICVDRLGRIWAVWTSWTHDSLGDLWFSRYDGREWSGPASIHPSPGGDGCPYLITDKENPNSAITRM